MNGFTDALSINPDHTTWNVTWTVLTQIQLNCVFFAGYISIFVLSPVFKYKALVCVLPSFIWVLYQGWIFLGPTEWKNITDLFCFKRVHFKVFVFLCFLSWRMQTFQRAQKVWRLNSQISQDGTFVYYPFFVLNILLFTLFTFSYLNFFLLFVCFDIRWQLETTHACNNTPDRDAILRAKMTSLDAIFCRGNKSSSSSLARFCRRKHKKSNAQALRAWKNLS